MDPVLLMRQFQILLYLIILTGMAGPGYAKPRSGGLLDNTPITQAQHFEKQKNYQQAADMYLLTAKILAPPESEKWRGKAAEMAWLAGNLEQARKIIMAVDEARLEPLSRAQLRLTAARIARYRQDYQQVVQLLDFPRSSLPQRMNREILHLLGEAQQKAGRKEAHAAVLLERYGRGGAGGGDRLWIELMALETQDLSRWLGRSTRPLERGWIELAYIAKTSPSKAALNDVLQQWQQRYPGHPAYPGQVKAVREQQKNLPGKLNRVAVLLPTSGPLSHLAGIVIDGIMAAKYAPGGTQTDVHIYDTGSGQDVYALYRQAISEGAEMIIGPMSKPLVDQLATSPLAVPILSLNYGNNPELYNPKLYQFALLPEDEARQAAEKIAHDGISRTGVLVPDSRWGERIALAFGKRSLELGGTVVATAKYGTQSSDYSAVIEKAFKPDEEGNGVGAEAIFLAATPKHGRILKPLLKYHYLGNLPTYATSHVYSGLNDSISDRDLNGITFTEIPWLLQKDTMKSDVEQIPQVEKLDEPARHYPRLFAFGYDSLQLAARLQQLVQTPGTQHNGLTGNLTIDNRNNIHRILGWARFRRGEPEMLALPPVGLRRFEMQSQPGSIVTPLTSPLRSIGENPGEGR